MSFVKAYVCLIKPDNLIAKKVPETYNVCIMSKYNPHEIEAKWRNTWPKERKSYELQPGDEPYYVLDMISYPSSEGLHMGHWLPYTIADVWARYNTLLGKKVLSPVGFDAFGLPAENAAIKTSTHPTAYTQNSIKNFSRQLQEMGKMYDWSTLIDTSSPEYYRWTQWIFIQLYNAGLAYRKASLVNWCPNCQTVLANEQVINGRCERCDSEVAKRDLKQWFLKITDFADDLLNFDGLDWPEKVKTMQTNWIGKSEGAEVVFDVEGSNETIRVFTTRVDTLFGVTYVVVAPEYSEVLKLVAADKQSEVIAYIDAAKKQTDIERANDTRPKTGVFTGSYAIHPFTGEKLPIWVADYVLGSYGTGAVMAVPAHDERDYVFAQKYGLPIKHVIKPILGTPQENSEHRTSIVAVVYDPEQQKYLTIDWGDLGGTLFIGGGVDSNEDVVSAAMREIAEETGYTDLKFIKQTEQVHYHYFAHSKNVARNIDATGLLLELTSPKKRATELEQDEQGKFSVGWVSKGEAMAKVHDVLHGYVFDRLLNDSIYTSHGVLIDSGEFTGVDSSIARHQVADRLNEMGKGGRKTQYRLRDWLVSRQRYWGAPIPIVYCADCGEQAVNENELPIVLPPDAEFLPTGGSPLERHATFKDVTCQKCGKQATRETDTLDTFVDSSWYYLRYLSPRNTQNAFDKEQVAKWMPVDFYVGGTEHSILHLLYARFVMKALHRLGHVPYHEPFQTFFGNGMVYLDGKKMSKSKGNIVNPDEMVKLYGTDALRGYMLFMGPADQDVEWQQNGILGVSRFLGKIWSACQSQVEGGNIRPAVLQSAQLITKFLNAKHFNRCISQFMILVREFDANPITTGEAKLVLTLMAPFFPHIAEELWQQLGCESSVFASRWPDIADFAEINIDVTYAIQVNGKVRATITADSDADENTVVMQAKEIEGVARHLEGKSILKTVFIAGRTVNFVVE